jgi:hypothetical protein
MGHRVALDAGGEAELKRRCLETLSHLNCPPDAVRFDRLWEPSPVPEPAPPAPLPYRPASIGPIANDIQRSAPELPSASITPGSTMPVNSSAPTSPAYTQTLTPTASPRSHKRRP